MREKIIMVVVFLIWRYLYLFDIPYRRHTDIILDFRQFVTVGF